MGRKIGKRLFCLGTLLAMMMGVGAQAESTTYDYWDGNVHFKFTAEDMDATTVTPFVGKYYQFQDTEEIARIVYGESDFVEDSKNERVSSYEGVRGSLTVGNPGSPCDVHFESLYSETVLTPIRTFVEDLHLEAAMEKEDSELTFMSRAEAEQQAALFMEQLYVGADFRAVKNYAITKSDYDALYAAQKEDIEKWFDDPKMSEGDHPWYDFGREDLGYMVYLNQYVNGYPITDKWNQKVRSLKTNIQIGMNVMWSPEGCMYIRTCVESAIQHIRDCEPCTIISREAAMNTLAEAYNYVLGNGPLEIWNTRLEWYGDYTSDCEEEIIFRPMWCFYAPYYYESELEGTYCVFVDACTGEAFLK